MKTLSARERRLIAVLILVAAIAAAWLLLLAPLIDGFAARRGERAELLAQHRRNQQLAATIPLLRGAAARQRAEAGRFALPVASREAAVTLLRGRLRGLARSHGVVIKSVQEVEGQPGWASIQADGTFRTSELAAYLQALQNEDPIVLVRSLSIVADAAFQTGRAEPMEVRLEVAAPYAAPRGR